MVDFRFFVVVVATVLLTVVSGQSFGGSYCGTTANNALFLNFTFPSSSSYSSQASFQMTSFQTETFPVCPSETFQFTPTNSKAFSPTSSSVTLGEIAFSGMLPANAGTDCMAVQLQEVWITDFTLLCNGLNFSSDVISSMTLTAGAYSMGLVPC